MTTIGEEALSQAMPLLQGEYESEFCAVCGESKWPNYPFCRACSIKLQRAHLMKRLQDLIANEVWIAGQSEKWDIDEVDEQARKPGSWSSITAAAYWRHYDRCRDYLMVTRRFPVSKVQDLDFDG